jgi:DNA adenine methylase
MRFNKKGKFNVPFCKKVNRFSPSYITKICNQVKKVRQAIKGRQWEFKVCDWQATLQEAQADDFVYCDPPYIGRHTDYYNSWSDEDAARLAKTAKTLPCGFAVSMWQENKYRTNRHIPDDWGGCEVKTYSHFYHVGSTESLRNKMTEALIIRPGFAANSQAEPTN